MTLMDEDKRLLQEIHRAIVGSVDGSQKGFNERISALESFRNTFCKLLWLVIGSLVANVGVFVTQMVLWFAKGGN